SPRVLSSSGTITRPRAAPTPSTWKYVPDTSSPDTRSVRPFTPMFIATCRRATRPEKILGVGAAFGTGWLTPGRDGPSDTLSRQPSNIGNDSMLPPLLLP